jgi:intergrase/recombinase
LSDDLSRANFKIKVAKMLERNADVELTEKKQRSLKQNSYMHVAIAYFASVTGYDAEYVKREYFKKECNKELFLVDKYDTILKRNTEDYRSSRSLTKEEMTLAIERFRNWAAREAELYIPSAEEYNESKQIQREMNTTIEHARQHN